MKTLAAILIFATASLSLASDLRKLRPKKVTQSFPSLDFDVTASIAKGGIFDLSIVLDGENIPIPKKAFKGIDLPQLETLAFASPSSTGRALERDHLKESGFEITLKFGTVRSHGESGVTEVSVYPHLTLYFGPEGFEGRILVVPEGDYSNRWSTIIELDSFQDSGSTTSSVEYPDPRFPNRWQTAEDIDNARKEHAKRTSEGLFPEETKPAEQGGARQPATAPDSKSEGSEKPKPESEGRSQ